MSDFDDFAVDAANLFGLNEHEAADLLDRLEDDHGFNVEEDDLRDFMPDAFEELSDDYFETDDFGYELDPDFPDDDWLDAGDVWEISADYTD